VVDSCQLPIIAAPAFNHAPGIRRAQTYRLVDIQLPAGADLLSAACLETGLIADCFKPVICDAIRA
jgi:hypothetical protein